MKNKDSKLETLSIQSFGYLIVTDKNLNLVGISQETLVAGYEAEKCMGMSLEDFIPLKYGMDSKIFIDTIKSMVNKRLGRQLTSITLKHKLYYVKTTKKNNLIYIEWEYQHKKNISATELNDLAFLFEQHYKFDWQYLCQGINMLLKFDRIIIVQLHETNHCEVIAEHSSIPNEKFLNQVYDSSFIPAMDHTYFISSPYRYIPNRDAKQGFYTSTKNIDLGISQLAPAPVIQEKFLINKNIESAIYFPLIVHDKLWGLVIAHNKKKNNIDLQKRKLCTFIVQNAMSKYENFVTQTVLNQNEVLFNTEIKLKSEFPLYKTSNCLIVNNLSLILNLTQSHGIAVYNQGDIFVEGVCPSIQQIHEIIDYLRNNVDKPIFKDYNFKLNRSHIVSGELPIAGVMSCTLDQDKEHYILWFRKEYASRKFEWTCADIQELDQQLVLHEKEIKYSSIPWSENEITFVNKLQTILKDFIISKNKERQLQTDDLVRMNNELEMFTYSLSHDIKNPLSVLKMGIQFLHNNNSVLQATDLSKWYLNLLGSINNIEDIINNIVKLSSLKASTVRKEPLAMNYTIHKIVQEVQLLYGTPETTIHYKELYPIWGEKSSLYQIFLNIIGNAIKYSSTQEHPEVIIESCIQNNYVCYSIKDNGIGIPSSKRNQIFEMFGRADNALQFQGSGIGMALVKRIMDRMDGNIKIKSKLDEGTQIQLLFPIVAKFPTSMLDNL